MVSLQQCPSPLLIHQLVNNPIPTPLNHRKEIIPEPQEIDNHLNVFFCLFEVYQLC